ncbi:hypothetical protein GUJ93_ZPchr0001g33059 [Zizania palustris]|uniref:Uncharacterized protein n=1 Tax=Zizania palustris TaxID=103762 RepID=A0A8J5RRK5_ZIZPA|nr:hypothetical protein GUJ93_ZPchr0001g33059 [Zizania palustris]
MYGGNRSKYRLTFGSWNECPQIILQSCTLMDCLDRHLHGSTSSVNDVGSSATVGNGAFCFFLSLCPSAGIAPSLHGCVSSITAAEKTSREREKAHGGVRCVASPAVGVAVAVLLPPNAEKGCGGIHQPGARCVASSAGAIAVVGAAPAEKGHNGVPQPGVRCVASPAVAAVGAALPRSTNVVLT